MTDPPFRSLFSEPATRVSRENLLRSSQQQHLNELRPGLLERAEQTDLGVLLDADHFGNQMLYTEVFEAVFASVQSDPAACSRMIAFLNEHDQLPVTQTFAQFLLESFQNQPTPTTARQCLFFSARTGSAALYSQMVDQIMAYWRRGSLTGIEPANLAALIESQFWLLPVQVRSSGDGHVFKRVLALIRRELTAQELF
ncbi:MAG: hypothetical protein HY774_12730 [Acidobacteria bacterium]|nr:hypothetical protein [Acidobacteriota bacterium]